ncbi:MAG TPA: cobyrinate a,c-diamide synthase [bacterium]|nr:cobyrinate a,c-diamide synthase [bacterium]
MTVCRSPRLVLSGLRGGSGKTLVSLGLISAWRESGFAVAPFKKGPDYIDPAWLGRAAHRSCHNLDSFFCEPTEILASFAEQTMDATTAVIEGNRGLYDGVDAEGSHSTAELAKLLKSPVVLIVDCTKTTRTLAAMLLGCQTLDREVFIAGVIVNRVAGSRHESVIRKAIEQETGLPVLGALRSVSDSPFSERHLGLLPPSEHPDADEALDQATRLIQENVDLDAMLRIARSALPLTISEFSNQSAYSADVPVRIGVIRDSAFNFYYPDNLQSLRDCGAEIVEISALADRCLPDIDGLYIGGGFPETHAARLAANTDFRQDLLCLIDDGLPVLAECGGLVYLCESLLVDGSTYPMVGVFPVSLDIAERPVGHGYVEVVVDASNPFFGQGHRLRGHEFRYSRVHSVKSESFHFALAMKKGVGFDGERDGLCYRNVLASFCHFHARGVKGWAEGLVRQAVTYAGLRFVGNINGPLWMPGTDL